MDPGSVFVFCAEAGSGGEEDWGERTERKYFPLGPLQHEVEFIIKIFHDLHK